MKVEVVLVYALQAIYIAECRLRKKADSELEVSLELQESSEPETAVRIYDDQDQNKVGKDKLKERLGKEKIKEQIEKENAAGSFADALAPNQHYSISTGFKDLGRRFVPQYPYYEKDRQEVEDRKAEDYLHKEIQDGKTKYEIESMKLLPVRASPDLVLSVVRQSKALEDAKPANPADEVIKKEILRSGDYWNDVWKENVEESKLTALRTGHEKLPPKGSIRTKIMPGTKLYQLISLLSKISPRFLYVINEN